MTHSHPDQLIRLCKESNWAAPDSKNKYDTFRTDNAHVHVQDLRSHLKTDFKSFKKAFNREVQADVLFFEISNDIFKALHSVDFSTSYSEIEIVN